MSERHSNRSMADHPPLRLVEAFGILPLKERWRQARATFRGIEDVPPSRFELSSLRMLRPRLALPLWRARLDLPFPASLFDGVAFIDE